MKPRRKSELPAPRTTTEGGALPLDEIENQQAHSVQFDFEGIDGSGEIPPPLTVTSAEALGSPEALLQFVDWLCFGEYDTPNARAAAHRVIALGWFLQLPRFTHANVSELAQGLGLSAEGINKYVRALNLRYGVYSAGQKRTSRGRDRSKATGHTPSPSRVIGDPSKN